MHATFIVIVAAIVIVVVIVIVAAIIVGLKTDKWLTVERKHVVTRVKVGMNGCKLMQHVANGHGAL
jgi:hypothetical protein